MNRMANAGMELLLSLALLGVGAAGQSQNQAPATGSLGDYARQVRKTAPAGDKAKVFDNDNLPRQDQLSIVGPQSPTSGAEENRPGEAATGPSTETKNTGEANSASNGETKGTNEESAAAVSPKTPEEERAEKQQATKQWADKLSAQKDKIDLLARELDVLQREYQLRAAAMYGDVGNRLRNETNWDQQDAKYKQQIADKQKELDDAKQQLDDMEEQARKAGVPESVREP